MTEVSPVNSRPHVLFRTSLISANNIGSAFNSDKSSERLPAVDAQGVIISRPRASACAKIRAFSANCNFLFACLIIPAPQLVAPSRFVSLMPNDLARGTIESEISGEPEWATLPGWYA